MTLARHKRDAILLGVLGLVVALGYGLADVDFGGEKLSSADAWARGVAQPYVLAGAILIVLAVFVFRGADWPRWPILLWGPITIVGGMLWALSRGVGTFDLFEFSALGAPILVFWVWGVHRMLFARRGTSVGHQATD